MKGHSSESDRVFDLPAAEALPENVRFGTSSWTYPGWQGLIYRNAYKNDKEFRAKSLGEYAECPLFRAVGIDRTFYAPPTEELLAEYSSLVPPTFRWVSKVWERLTLFRYPSHPRYGRFAGQLNEDFLNPSLFNEEVLPGYMQPNARKRTGPFVFQFGTFPRQSITQEEFLEKLQHFLAGIPSDFRYATELRNPDWLTPDYFKVLNSYGATHCFNHWNYMPPLIEQMKRAAVAGGLQADFYVTRILTPLGMSYQQAVEKFQPYNEIKAPNEAMRKDVRRLVKRAIERNADAFIIVNNRCEGNSPMTINSILQSLP